MKKLKKIIPVTTAILITATATISKLKADMKIEQMSFSVVTDTSNKPSAYCMNSDGSQISWDYSFSGYFCIPGCMDNNVNMMAFDNIPAYCIGRHDQKSPTSTNQVDKCTDIDLSSPEFAKIFSITANGYGCGESMYGLNDVDFYYVTQCAIRSTIYGIPSENLSFFDISGNINPYMNDEFIRLCNSADTTLINEEKSLTLENSSDCLPVYIEDSCYYRYGPYRPTAENFELLSYTVNFEDKDNFIFLSEDFNASANQDIYDFEANDEFYVYINALFQDETTFTIETETTQTIYDPIIYLTHDDTFQDIAQMKLSTRTTPVSVDFSLTNVDTTGTMVVNKIFKDENKIITDDKLISQPRFTIQNKDGKYVNGIYTNDVVIFTNYTDSPVEFPLCKSSSSLCIENLPVGDYKITESKGATDYLAIDEILEITNTSDTDTVEFINYKIFIPEVAKQPVTETTTTTPAPTTTTTTYTEQTTYQTTQTEEITTSPTEFPITTTTQQTALTTSYLTETTSHTTTTVTTSETTTITTPAPPAKTTPKSMPPRIYQSPPTGDTTPLPAIISALFLSLTTAVVLKRKK